MKDLEVMTQNLISSAFETVRDVEHGVEIQDIFHHLSEREVGGQHPQLVPGAWQAPSVPGRDYADLGSGVLPSPAPQFGSSCYC